MKTFTLEIRTPEKKLFHGQVRALTVRALDGGLGVLAGHAPLATALAPGKVSYRGVEKGGAEGRIEGELEVQSGFLFLDNGAATVLVTATKAR
jgi:F-type H+-transporting ATPase subunit epsilon